MAEHDIVAAALALGTEGDGARIRNEAAGLFLTLATLNLWLDGRDRKGETWIGRARALAAGPDAVAAVDAAFQEARDARDFPDVFALLRAGRVEQARHALLRLRKNAGDAALAARAEHLVADPRRMLGPVEKAPTLFTLNTFGARLYGRGSVGADGTYVATYCVCALFLPLVPLAAYLVAREGKSYRFHGRVPLGAFARTWRALALTVPLLVVGIGTAMGIYASSPYAVESRRLRAARAAVSRNDPVQVLRDLEPILATTASARRVEAFTLARQALGAALGSCRDERETRRFALATKLIPPGAAAQILDTKLLEGVEACAATAASTPGRGGEARRLLVFLDTVAADFHARRLAVLDAACVTGSDSTTLALAATWHADDGVPCPPALLAALARRLEERYPGWDADVLSYVRAADPESARPFLFARVESVWKGQADDPAVRVVAAQAPACLRRLLELDGESDGVRARAGLLSIAEPDDGIPEPQATWHRLGVARRLARVCESLHADDPVSHPIDEAVQWAVTALELAPRDGELRATALRTLLLAGDATRAVEIGEQGDGGDAIRTYLGMAYARVGRLEDARETLAGHVEQHLAPYVRAFEKWQRAADQKQTALIGALRDGSGDQAFIARLNALPDARAKEEVRRFVDRGIESDRRISELHAAWLAHASVHEAARELALVELQLGRLDHESPTESRRHLEEAERLFLELRRAGGDDIEQELALGQVDFWLRKEAEGRAIFDRLEAEGDGGVLLALGDVYRDLGHSASARRVLEAAYRKLPDPDAKQGVALLRSRTATDPEDSMRWLERADGTNPFVQCELQQARASLLLFAGRYAEAATLLEKAGTFYRDQPEDVTSLNNHAVIEMSLYVADGDGAHLEECHRLMRRAMEVTHEDAIFLGNAVSVLEQLGYLSLLGDSLRLDLLHTIPAADMLSFCVPQPTVEAWAERARRQADLRQAVELGVRAALLGSGHDVGYEAQIGYHVLARDLDALRSLRRSLTQNPPAREADPAATRAARSGASSEAERHMGEGYSARLEAQLPAIRASGSAPSLAYQLTRLARAEMAAVRLGLEAHSIDRAIAWADEAVRTLDLPATRHLRHHAMAERASLALESDDPEYAALSAASRDVDPTTRLWLHALIHPERRVRIAALSDMSSIGADGPDPDVTRWDIADWMWLSLTSHADAERVGRLVAANDLDLEAAHIRWLLAPASSSTTLELLGHATLRGDDELANRVRSVSGTLGVVVGGDVVPST